MKKRWEINVARNAPYYSSSPNNKEGWRRQWSELKATQELEKGMQQLLSLSPYKDLLQRKEVEQP